MSSDTCVGGGGHVIDVHLSVLVLVLCPAGGLWSGYLLVFASTGQTEVGSLTSLMRISRKVKS